MTYTQDSQGNPVEKCTTTCSGHGKGPRGGSKPPERASNHAFAWLASAPLMPAAKRTGRALARHASFQKSPDIFRHLHRGDLACWVKGEVLAKEVGCSRRTVHRHIRQLCAAGLERRRTIRSNSYIFPLVERQQPDPYEPPVEQPAPTTAPTRSTRSPVPEPRPRHSPVQTRTQPEHRPPVDQPAPSGPAPEARPHRRSTAASPLPDPVYVPPYVPVDQPQSEPRDEPPGGSGKKDHVPEISHTHTRTRGCLATDRQVEYAISLAKEQKLLIIAADVAKMRAGWRRLTMEEITDLIGSLKTGRVRRSLAPDSPRPQQPLDQIDTAAVSAGLLPLDGTIEDERRYDRTRRISVLEQIFQNPGGLLSRVKREQRETYAHELETLKVADAADARTSSSNRDTQPPPRPPAKSRRSASAAGDGQLLLFSAATPATPSGDGRHV